MKPKIALSMIVKNEEDCLARCLDSVKDYVDGIFIVDTGSTDGTAELARSYGARVDEVGDKFKRALVEGAEPIFLFDEARNYAFSIIPPDYEYILWLDADDEVLGAENLPAVVARAKREGVSAVFFNYIYQAEFDEEGNIQHRIIEHQRERLLRNDGSYKWESHIHETLIPQREGLKQITETSIEVLHHITEEEMAQNIDRNIAVLEQQAEKEDHKDPRTLYYLAKAYFDIRNRNPEKYIPLAKALIDEYLSMSGWPQERAQAYNYLGEIHRINGCHVKSIQSFLYSLWESPEYIDTYVNIAMSYVLLQEWDKALHWVKLATHIPETEDTLIRNPKQTQHRIMEVLYHAALNKRMIDEAWAAAYKLQAFVPEDDPEIQKRLQLTSELKLEKELTKKFIGIGKYLRRQGDLSRLRALMSAVPPNIADNPLMSSMRKEILPPKTWAEDEIAIYCGPGFESWSPNSVGKGIGGSEEAVIYLSQELRDLGYKVTVFAEPAGEAGDHDGVYYAPHFHFNLKDEFNIVIGWRNVALFDYDINAKKNYLWLHDIPNPRDFTDKRVAQIDKIIVLSEWHRERLPDIGDDKFMVSANGIRLEQFPNARKIIRWDRNPQRMIYTSSYDRGLEHLLKMWPEIIEEVPDAELHVFYGWNLFDSFYKDNPERMAWKHKMSEMMEQDGITHHGRVGQDQIVKETLKSGVWAYPTHFGEISCISAMKGQAGGAVPVVTDYAALKETVQYGVKVDGDIYLPEVQEEYKDKLVALLKDEDGQQEIREEMVPWALKKFSWENVAKQWAESFGDGD